MAATRVDRAMRMLSRSANKGRLWLALAAARALVPGRTRRAAIRGVAALSVTSFVTNAILKPVTRRKRPLLELTPVVRRLRPTEPTRVREHVPAPTIADGEDLVLVVNQRSGADDDPVPMIQDRLPAAELVTLDPGLDLDAELRRRARHARAFGVVGGDGSVAAAAAAAATRRQH